MRSVCIVGSAPSTANLVYQELPWVEVWASGSSFHIQKRIDRWFEIHADGLHNPDPAYPTWLKQFKGQIYTVMGEGDTIRYPVEKVSADIDAEYLTSTPAYMLALAIYEGVDEIKIYGVDNHPGSDWGKFLPGMTYLLGIARGRGVKVVIPKESSVAGVK